MIEPKIPTLVKKVQLALYHKQPIPPEIIEDVLTKYPQYFSKEVEKRKAWASIPESVKEAYTKDWTANHVKLFSDFDKKAKYLSLSINPKLEEQKLQKEYDQLRLKEIVVEKKLHRKYYEKHGVRYE